MRIELAGSLILPAPLVLRFETNGNFSPQQYIDMGYTHFDVICIGAGGGSGGGIDTANTGTLIRAWGGAGGGGGFHRVQGLLSALPTTCPVVVGTGGAVGTTHASNPASTTDGSDGGFSTFNTNTCRASGGKGGKRVQSNSETVSTQANGGDGGSGNRTAAGGGGLGGVAGTPANPGPGTPGTPGADGIFIYNNGRGGGGGAGGVGKYGGLTLNEATAGGRGSYNPGDTSVYGPGGIPAAGPQTGAVNIIPGGASGAKASPLTGLPAVFGQSMGDTQPGTPGIVVLRLTAE
jgi:Glycine-rich domain